LDGSAYRAELAFSPDNRTLAIASEDGQVFRWDTTGSAEPVPLPGPRPDKFFCLDFSPDGRLLAAGGTNGVITTWETETWTPRSNLTAAQNVAVFRVAFSPDSKTLAAGNGIGTIELWQLGHAMRAIMIPGPTGGIEDIAFHPEGQILLA